MPRRKTLAQTIIDLERENGELTARLAAANLQLAFWKENSRGLENNVRMWMGLHSEAMQMMAKLGEAPIPFEEQAARIKAALAAPGPGVEALIMAVSLASAGSIDRLRGALPELAPMFAPLLAKLPKRLPKKPKVQAITNAQAERVL